MAAASDSSATKPGKSKKGCCCLIPSLVAIVLIIVLGIAVGPITGSISKAQTLYTMMSARELAVAFAQYAADHNGQYPIGKSSTEVFQKLMDDGYVTDPSMFVGGYPHTNKTRLTDFHDKLKPENVGFDVTVPVDASASNHLPVVFLTGYRITYSAGSNAVPLSRDVRDRIPCMAIGYKNSTATVFAIRSLRLPPQVYWNSNGISVSIWGPGALSDGTIPNFIPTEFKANGKVYHQLTPDGELPP